MEEATKYCFNRKPIKAVKVENAVVPLLLFNLHQCSVLVTIGPLSLFRGH